MIAITEGVVIQRRNFDAWGATTSGSSAFDRRGYTGHEHLDEVGLIHMNGRIYDPVLGRFLQADPIIQAPYDLQSFNRYTYVLNNPLSLIDPTGFSWWTKWRRSILAIAAAITMQHWAIPTLLAGAGLRRKMGSDIRRKMGSDTIFPWRAFATRFATDTRKFA